MDGRSYKCLIEDAETLYYIFAGAAVVLMIYQCLLAFIWKSVGGKWGVMASKEGETGGEQGDAEEENGGGTGAHGNGTGTLLFFYSDSRNVSVNFMTLSYSVF